jgi:hypothetical protein
MGAILVTQRNSTPIFLRDLGRLKPRWAQE